jgi:hypothetical protein
MVVIDAVWQNRIGLLFVALPKKIQTDNSQNFRFAAKT